MTEPFTLIVASQPWPASANVWSPARIPTAAFHDVSRGKRPFPPIGWFERVVNMAICRFIATATAHPSEVE